jgi:hypothetical protein
MPRKRICQMLMETDTLHGRNVSIGKLCQAVSLRYLSNTKLDRKTYQSL